MARSLLTRLLLPALVALALAASPALAEQGPQNASSITQTSSSTLSSSSATATTTTSASTSETTTVSSQSAPEPVVAPQVHAQAPQAAAVTPHVRHARAGAPSTTKTGGKGTTPSNVSAPPPGALTPPPPSALGSAVSGVPSFFIANFSIPPFLLPIYQAAGRAYGIPWQVLAAINEVETDYGRDLSLSSAGAEGWMQFLPSSWAMYGVDANGDGYADPYNPADAIFAAARYLKAAGGARHIDAAIFAYNHSQSYVASVLLRAQLLSATPPQLLEALTSLTEARFPVHAPAHFADGFPTVAATAPGASPRTLVGTTIYSSPGAPVIAAQDGVIAAIGSSPTLGRYVKLRDAYGNTYTYGELGSVAALYPVLKPHRRAVSSRSAHAAVAATPTAPASAGAQPHSPLSAGAVSSELALGAATELEDLPTLHAAHAPAPQSVRHARRAPAPPLVFRAGSEEVYLHSLRVGSHVIAGTVIGHLAMTPGEASMLFQIRPAGVGAPQIDPKPLLDSWVQLQGSLLFRVTGKHRFPAATPAPKPTSCASPGALTAAPLPAAAKTLKGAKPLLAPKPLAASCSATALAAVAESPALTPTQWLQLTARLGQIPDPVVSAKPSAAAIPDHPSSAPTAPSGTPTVSPGEGSGVND
jgi:soluble lytic murein transglycosylase-like protein